MHIMLGYFKVWNEDYKGGRDYIKSYRNCPKHLEHIFRGIFKIKLNDQSEQLKDFTAAIEIDPKKAEIYYDREFQRNIREDYRAIEDYIKL
jgi:protein tyrosine/serine phosphatase